MKSVNPLPAEAKCKLGIQNATNILDMTLPGPTGLAYNVDRICIKEKVIIMSHGRFVHVDKTLTDLLILGCELHQNTSGGQ